jgi:hypothetical protein
MTIFLLIPFITYILVDLRAARRRERRLWSVIEQMAGRVDDMSVELGLLPPRERPTLREAADSGLSEATLTDLGVADLVRQGSHLRVVNGGK